MQDDSKQWLTAFGPALLYMALIWALSSFPLQFDMSHIPFRDKGVHFIEYGTLGALFAHALALTWRERSARLLWLIATLSTLLWGATDEIHQAFVPGRNSDGLDLVADALGASTFAALYLFWRCVRTRAARETPADSSVSSS